MDKSREELRTELIRRGAEWYGRWNYKVWRQEIGDPHPADRLAGDPPDVVPRKAIERQMALDWAVADVEAELFDYYQSLSPEELADIVDWTGTFGIQRLQEMRSTYRLKREMFAAGIE